MFNLVHVLLILTINYGGWIIIPVPGNPYSTAAECQEILDTFIKGRITSYEGLHFTDVRCEARQITLTQ